MAKEKSGPQLVTRIVEYLKQHPEIRLTGRNLSNWFVSTYPDDCLEKQNKSHVIKCEGDLLVQIAAEIASNTQSLQKKGIKTTATRPRQYYYSKQSEEQEVESLSTPPGMLETAALLENDMYPLLCEYLWNEFGLYTKRINEKKSTKEPNSKGKNKWLHPDIVALQDLAKNWENEIKNCVAAYSDKKLKLWSFEVKLKINRSNVREVFFQTVSNSSWANYGYLVAAEINDNAVEELRMLSNSHNIGIINLDITNPSESQILIPVHEKPEIDWDSINRIATENTDFKEFVKLITESFSARIREADWDLPQE